MKNALFAAAIAVAVFVAASAAAYVWNTAPVVPAISQAEATHSTKPYVIKLHAQWCPICMATTGVWTRVEQAYQGRANFVVFDFTNDSTTARSRSEAVRLGLGDFFETNVGWTGAIAVLDSVDHHEIVSVHGVHRFDEYRSAIDRALLSRHALN